MTVDDSYVPGNEVHPMLVTATVYRDDAQVSSMIQQGVEIGVAAETRHTGATSDRATSHDATTTSGSGSAAIGVNAVARLGGDAGRSVSRGSTSERGGDRSGETTFTHSSAGHLHRVLTALGNANRIRTVGRLQEAKDVQVGDFVEFQATFRPNELATMLDVITPEVAGEIARHRKRAESLSLMDAVEYADFSGWVEKRKYKEDSAAELARLVVRGIQSDLRSDQTREYHARIRGTRTPLTAVLACEAGAFVTADPDRLLDGQFSVVGKVISPASRDVSVFERSKLLARIQPESLDAVQALLEGAMDEQATDLAGNTTKLGDVIDLHFPSRIEGWSFGVLPIVIYV